MTSPEVMGALALVPVILVILWAFNADWEQDHGPRDDFLPDYPPCPPCNNDCEQGRDCPNKADKAHKEN